MVLVTGGTGLVGSHLLKKLLETGELVKAIYRNENTIPQQLKHPNINWVKADINNIPDLEDAFENVDYVYHCAAVVSFNPKNKEQLFKINVEGTANIVNISLHKKVKKLIYVSSVASLGRIRHNETVSESMNWTEESSNSVYGETKYLGEMHVWRGIEEGLHAAIVNPSIIIGNANWETGSASIFKNVYYKFPYYSTGCTGFVDVLDVVNAMQLLMKSNLVGERYILSADNLTYQQMFNMVADGFNKPHATKKVTPFLAGIVWRWEKLKSMFSGKEPLVTKETAHTVLTIVHFDNRKSLTIPNFTYTEIKKSVTRICSELKLRYNLT
jgi:dihydroflavonol-4-reductase